MLFMASTQQSLPMVKLAQERLTLCLDLTGKIIILAIRILLELMISWVIKVVSVSYPSPSNTYSNSFIFTQKEVITSPYTVPSCRFIMKNFKISFKTRNCQNLWLLEKTNSLAFLLKGNPNTLWQMPKNVSFYSSEEKRTESQDKPKEMSIQVEVILFSSC